jgi:HEAT repeat protein
MTGPDPPTGSVLLSIAWVLLLGFLLLAVVCIVVLLGLRIRRRIFADRRAAETRELRAELVAVIVGEEPDASEAAARLAALRGRRWRRADELLVGMLPKVRGHAKERVHAILRGQGAEDHALARLGSGRTLDRCRGAFALGAMGATGATERIVPLLADRSALVRRVAVRALGMMQDPAAAGPLLDTANRPDAVQRDLIQALIQLGTAAAPALHSRLVHFVAHPDANDRSAPAAAAALGFMGDATSARLLAVAVDGGSVALQLAAVQALGHLDVPVGVPALQRALISPVSAQVQYAAAASLGRLGAESAIPELLHTVEHGGPTVSRSAASALLDLGPAGRAALVGSGAPYAMEALAIDDMRLAT